MYPGGDILYIIYIYIIYYILLATTTESYIYMACYCKEKVIQK